MIKTVYCARNINGHFNHCRGKRAALAYARGIERDPSLSESEMVSGWGWRFRRVSPAYARSVGLG